MQTTKGLLSVESEDEGLVRQQAHKLGEGDGRHADLELAHAEDVEGEQRLRAPDADVGLRLPVAPGALARGHHLPGGVQVHAGTDKRRVTGEVNAQC